VPSPTGCDVVVATRDRRDELLQTLCRLRSLVDVSRIIVVDNGSSDGTAHAVRTAFADVTVIEAMTNLGAAARNVGVEESSSPIVAFSDDDSWWEPGALSRAVRLFHRYPRMAVLAARILLSGQLEDRVCAEMAASPLPDRVGLPGPSLLGFVACGAVVRKEAFLEAGGFHPRLGLGSEEELLALDLARNGWGIGYVPEVVAHHSPSSARDRDGRRRLSARNSLWSAWLRLSLLGALRRSARIVEEGLRDRSTRQGIVEAVMGSLWVLRERRVVPAEVERDFRLITGSANVFR
jgi:GT2 family glycosyltransferase